MNRLSHAEPTLSPASLHRRLLQVRTLLARHAAQNAALEPLEDALADVAASLYSQEQRLLQRQQHVLAEQLMVAEVLEHYRAQWQQSADARCVTDEYGIIRQPNAALGRLLNLSTRLLTNKPLALLLVPDDRSRFRNFLAAFASDQTTATHTFRVQPRQQDAVEVQLYCTRLAAGSAVRPGQILWLLLPTGESNDGVHNLYAYNVMFEQAAVGMAHIGPTGRWQRVNARLCAILGYTEEELRARTVYDVTYPEDLEASRHAHKALMDRHQQETHVEKRYVRKDGSLIWAHVSATAVLSPQNNYLYNIAIIEDVTERRQIEDAEREQRTLAEALYAATLALSGTLRFDDVMNQILFNVNRVVPHDASALFLIEDEVAVVARLFGYQQSGLYALHNALNSQRLPLAENTLLQTLVASGQPQLYAHWSPPAEWQGLPQIHAVKSLVGTPISARGVVVGLLVLHSRTAGYFTEQHTRYLAAFATTAAAAIQTARAHEQARTLAVAEDRQRLARDLHDAVTQKLFSANIIAESLAAIAQNNPDKLSASLEQLQRMTRGAMAELRTLLYELRPDYLAGLELHQQLRLLTDVLHARSPIATTLKLQAVATPPPNVATAFYRIAQEALNNVVKHAEATTLEMRLADDGPTLVLTIQDNGHGFDPAQRPSGLGMRSMHERAAEIGAELTVTARPNGGTRVELRWRRTD